MFRTTELEELMACGQIGLLEAADRYSPTNKCSFATYAARRIRGAILDSTSGWFNQAVTHKPLDMVAATSPDRERRIDLRRAMQILTIRERRVLMLLYVEGWTMLEISLELGVTESRVCQIKNDAVIALRDRMARV